MQVSKIYASSKSNAVTQWVLFVKFMLSCVVFGYILYTVYTSNLQWESLLFVARGSAPVYLLFALLLVPVNWCLEAVKWQYLCKKVEPISFKKALASVLSGVGISLFVPQIAADASGRMLYLKSKSRLASSGAMLSGHYAQFVVTVLAGSISVFYLVHNYDVPGRLGWSLALFVLDVLLIIALLASANLLSAVNRIAWLQKVLAGRSFAEASINDVLVATILSISRYIIFVIQFLALLVLVEVSLPIMVLCMGVAFVFMAKTLMPVLNFVSDLGVREASALFFFGLFQVSPEKVIMASMALWSINILVPALLGLLIVWRWKLVS